MSVPAARSVVLLPVTVPSILAMPDTETSTSLPSSSSLGESASNVSFDSPESLSVSVPLAFALRSRPVMSNCRISPERSR